MPSLQSVTFDTTGLQLDREEAARRVWFTSDGDGISLNFFDKKPDIASGLRSLSQLQDFYLSSLRNSPAKLVEVSTMQIGGCRAIRLLIKAPQQPSGTTYVGSLTLPFRDFSYVVKVQCQEHGMTGLREAALFDRQLANGAVTLDSSGNLTGKWNPDAQEYDAEFPQHPLSRLRKLLGQIESSVTVEPATLRQPKFPLPA